MKNEKKKKILKNKLQNKLDKFIDNLEFIRNKLNNANLSNIEIKRLYFKMMNYYYTGGIRPLIKKAREYLSKNNFREKTIKNIIAELEEEIEYTNKVVKEIKEKFIL